MNHSISKSFMSRRKAADSAVARQRRSNNDRDDLEMESAPAPIRQGLTKLNPKREIFESQGIRMLRCRALFDELIKLNNWQQHSQHNQHHHQAHCHDKQWLQNGGQCHSPPLNFH